MTHSALNAILSLAMAGLALVPSTAVADEHVAIIKSVTGRVTVVRQAAALPATAGTPVYISDRLQSDSASTAGVVFKDGTTLTLGASSDLMLRDYAFKPAAAKYAFSAYLAKGSAIYSSGKIGKLAPEQVKVETPTATIGVRGTRFLVQAE